MDTNVRARRNPRKYDILLLGATGYTGALTAEHIAWHLPTDLKWAIAGRSRSKLEALARKLKDLELNRQQPGAQPSHLLSHLTTFVTSNRLTDCQ